MKENLTLSNCIEAVEEFHNSFGISNAYSPVNSISDSATSNGNYAGWDSYKACKNGF